LISLSLVGPRFVPPDELRSAIPEKRLKRLENWPRLIALRNEVLKALEVARQEKFIGGSPVWRNLLDTAQLTSSIAIAARVVTTF
jgi:hypothetical protein